MARKKSTAIPKEQKQAREFANLYVNGPLGLKDNWLACEQQLKKSFDSQNALVREAIYAEGGLIPDKMPSAPTDGEVDFSEVDLSVFDERLLEAETEEDWKALAKEMRPVMVGIMQGDIKASAAQSSILKHVLDRAYGRLGTKEKQVISPSGVVILPTLGERSDMKICPQCKYVLEKKYPKEEAKGIAMEAATNAEESI